ncbi:hypothetical protein BC628DRAFT_1334034 [Trametes gibbosa]|uniref:MYND-type domain-containing protein n=1 Tax=Trametes gibbosa TaxID=160864 RepID=A0A6G6FQJ2_9APHY|nr:hypothetical protein BC628DRAFT_1334034 [Trametes gibbosa]QIE48453.1 hypothetical protein [Trametes gibbosa]
MEPLSRVEKLKVLASMGLELPEGTKLVDEVLERRLRAALDAAQERDRIPANVQELAHWPRINLGERPLLAAVRRGNMLEAQQNATQGSSTGPALYVNPFMDLRQTIMSLANTLDNGLTWCTIQDPERDNHAINIRFLDVYEVDERTPAILILYYPVSRANAMEGARWVQYQVQYNPKSLDGVGMNINASLLEQKVLLKLLGMNQKLLPSSFAFERKRFEEKYHLSVILPVGPLGFEAIGKLTSDTGCEVCGKRGARRCAQCQSAAYCSTECQKIDWPTHKHTCRSLKGGRWCAVPFRATGPGMEGMYAALINRFTGTSHIGDVPINMQPEVGVASVPHPNAHGDRPFIVKIQVGLTGPARDTMMIYDRQRSFSEVYVARADDPVTFRDLVAEMTGPRGGYGGVKMYRWAKRSGDWMLDICVDRRPETDIKW